MTPLENYYHQLTEPNKSCLLALRNIILKQDPNITPEWKYGGPFFYYKQKMFCYLWIHKKRNQPYLGIVEGKHIEHELLVIEKTARMKKMFFDANEDLPIQAIHQILMEAISIYENRLSKTKK